jgi:hypothetical protein
MKTKRYATGDEVTDDMRAAAEAEGAKDDGPDSVAASTPAPAAKRTPIVTKEQLAASGLSLRDYLNKQQGLTRRGESKASAPSTSNKLGQPGGSISDAGSGRDVVEKQNAKVDLTSPMSALRSLMRNKSDREVSTPAKSESKLDLTSPMSALRSSGMFQGTKRGGGSYAKGGSVSSASKRADGIAQRGKTKGKMC